MAATPKVVDYTDVKDPSQFSTKRVPAGDYVAKIEKVDDHIKSGEKVSTQWVFTISLVNRARCSYPYYVNNTDVKFAWKSRGLCLAAGLAVPKKRVKVDPNKLVGKTIGITLDDDEYEGRPKSVITAVFPASEVSGEPKANASSDDTDDDVDDVDADDADLDDVDLEEV